MLFIANPARCSAQKERLLSRRRNRRQRDGVELNENPIFCIGKSFDGAETVHSRGRYIATGNENTVGEDTLKSPTVVVKRKERRSINDKL